MANADEENEKEENTLNSTYKILDTELAVLSSMKDIEYQGEIAQLTEEDGAQGNETDKGKDEIDRTVATGENLETRVISENNIEASFTNSNSDIQVKNQSSYDINDLLGNTNYELKNKNKVIIYHTHTCESYTSSENYSYEMTGAYRTTDLNYTVSKVRR